MDHAVRVAGAPSDLDPGAIRHDLVIVVLAVLIASLLSARLELNELLFALTRRWELVQIDELPTVLLVLATCLAWFSWRRYREARVELVRRRKAEARLHALLLENRRLSRQYLEGQESERKYLARELHDELGQYLNAIKTDAVSLRQMIDSPTALLRAAAAIDRHADYLYRVVRNLIRELRPVALDELGLKAALEHYLEQCTQRMPSVTFEISLKGELDSLGEPVSLAIYRLMQESLTNVSRHAGASRVAISVGRDASGDDARDAVTLTVADDGCGTDLRRTAPGLGLIGMRERVEMFGGKWHVTTRPGEGFRIVACIPLNAPTPATAA
jgi:two-component system sensor histidine kinase UhpB